MDNSADFLQNTALEDILKEKEPRKLISVFPETSIEETIQLLASQRVLSVPVYDKQTGNYLGFFDTLELVKFILNEAVRLKEIEYGDKVVNTAEFFPSFDIKNSTIQDVIVKSKRCSRIVIFTSSMKLIHVMNELKSAQSMHRVLVHRDNEPISESRILSQTDIVKYLTQHKEKLGGELLNTKVKDLFLLAPPNPPVISISVLSPAIEGFQRIAFHDIGGVAVVSEGEGKLMGILSASDLRGITPEQLSYLHMPILHFLRKSTGKPLVPPVVCSPEATLYEVLVTIVGSNVHRLFVVDEDNKPIGIITLTDIIDACTLHSNK